MSAANGAVVTPLGESVRRLVRQVLGQEAPAPAGVAAPALPLIRRSNGLREFWRGIQPASSLHILDLGSASQANVSFITGLGHKLYTEDLFQTTFAGPAKGDAQPDAGPNAWEERFFRENLGYSEGQFDGILGWNLLDFLPDPLVKPLVERLHLFLKPGGNLLAFFHTGKVGQQVPVYQYRIGAADTLEVIGRGAGPLRRSFNNRAIENLFRKFSSLKFYLSRDSLREVVIVR